MDAEAGAAVSPTMDTDVQNHKIPIEGGIILTTEATFVEGNYACGCMVQ
jgi:hypothetical protein